MDSKEPFSTREMLSLFLPAWLVTLLGPYRDEVGFWPFYIKWQAIAFLWVFFVHELVPEKDRAAYGAFSVATGLCGLVVWFVVYFWTRDE